VNDIHQKLITVILPTYNPDIETIVMTLAALRKQTLPLTNWELMIIDNNSTNNFHQQIDLSWHPAARLLVEKKQGLTYARRCGFVNAIAPIIIMVDDDNLLHQDFLVNACHIMEQDENLGAAGGKSIPLFLATPPVWLAEFHHNLALRDLGNEILISHWNHSYPSAAPIGAGMVIRKAALETYLNKRANTVITDRNGSSLSSGGDNDIILELLKSGYPVGYFPSLVLTHVIPPSRMQATYIARLVQESNKSWISLLRAHDILPWSDIQAWTVPIRKLKSFFSHRAWKGTSENIRWRSACGLFEGLAANKSKKRIHQHE